MSVDEIATAKAEIKRAGSEAYVKLTRATHHHQSEIAFVSSRGRKLSSDYEMH